MNLSFKEKKRKNYLSLSAQILQKGSGILLVSLGLSLIGFGQHLTVDKVKSDFRRIGSVSDDADQLLVKYVEEKVHAGNFVSKEQLLLSVKFIDRFYEQRKNPENYLRVLCLIARILEYHNDYHNAYPYIYKANIVRKDVKVISADLKFLLAEVNGLSDYYFGQYEAAKRNFLFLLSKKFDNPADRINHMNTLGLTYSSLKDYNTAKQVFHDGLKLAKYHKFKAWIGVLSGNLGFVYFNLKQYTKAIELLEEDVAFSRESQQFNSMFQAMALLIETHLAQGNTELANVILNDLEELTAMNIDNEIQLSVNKCRFLVNQALGNYKKALDAYQLYMTYLQKRNEDKNKANLENYTFRGEFEKQQNKLKILELQHEQAQKRTWFLLTFTFIVMGLSCIIILQIRKNRNKELQLSIKEKQVLDLELKQREAEMKSLLNHLMERNQMFEQLNDEFVSLQERIDQSDELVERQKIKDQLIAGTILTEEDWFEFKRLFEAMVPGFFNRVQEHIPDATNAEIRLMSLIRLNLGYNEIAKVLGISPDSVRRTSLRLRKKLDIDEPEVLTAFVLKL